MAVPSPENLAAIVAVRSGHGQFNKGTTNVGAPFPGSTTSVEAIIHSRLFYRPESARYALCSIALDGRAYTYCRSVSRPAVSI